MRFYTQQHRFYCGIDLHARLLTICIVDQAGNVVLRRQIADDKQLLLDVLAPFRPDVAVCVVAGFLWLTCHYDHRFEELNPTQAKLTWVIEAKGFGKSVIGRLFAKIYSNHLDRAIPLLVQEMNASRVS